MDNKNQLFNRVLNCPGLPSLPSVAMRVLELTRNEQVKIGEIARAVQNDQALCIRILRTVNSSYYGLSKPCPTISRAITYLGLNTVKSLVLGFSLVDVSRTEENGFDLIDHWRRALYSATAAKRVAAMSSMCDPEEAFIAALMQDLGMLAMHIALGEEYAEVVTSAEGQHSRLPCAEQELLGFDHALVGGKLGERWKLPTSLIEAILHHHDAQAVQHLHLVRTVALGGQLAETMTTADPKEYLNKVRICAQDWFRVNNLDPAALLECIDHDAREVSSLFQVEMGDGRDVHDLVAEAEDAALAHQVRVIKEADHLRERNVELDRQASTDALTGLSNRRRFDQVMKDAFAEAKRNSFGLGVILVDIDHFKRFNDTFGHDAGDTVLIEVAERMQSVLSGDALLARYGGEEFAIVLPGQPRQSSATVAESVRRAIAEAPLQLPPEAGGTSVELTASLGVACLEPGAEAVFKRPAILIAAADKALYAAKNAGRNCVRIFTPRTTAAPPATTKPIAAKNIERLSA